MKQLDQLPAALLQMDPIDQMIKPLMLSDLRTQLRARGENPGGSEAALRDRLKQNMVATGNYNLGSASSAPVLAGGRLPNSHDLTHPWIGHDQDEQAPTLLPMPSSLTMPSL